MKMSEKEILPVILILTIHIDTVVLLDEETRIVAEDNYVSRLVQTHNSNDDRTDKDESPSRRTLTSNDSIVDMGRSSEPSSRAIFLRPPAQLTQEDLELIDKRVEIKDNFDETFGGMETALVEVQRRGKAMMNTVRRQRELLSRLEEEMELVRDQREEVKTKLEKERRRSKEAEVERMEEEAEKDRVGKLMLHIATNLDVMEDKKASMVENVTAMREERQLLEGMVEEGRKQLEQLEEELQPLAKQVEVKNLDLVRVGREVKSKKRELNNLNREVEDKEKAFRSVTDAVSKLETSLQENQKEAITPWASDSPLVPWLISSVLFNLAAGVHYLTTNTVGLDTSTMERATVENQNPGYPEIYQRFSEEILGTVPSTLEADPEMNIDMALQLVQDVIRDDAEADKEEPMPAKQSQGKNPKQVNDNASQMQLDAESRPIAMRLRAKMLGRGSDRLILLSSGGGGRELPAQPSQSLIGVGGCDQQ